VGTVGVATMYRYRSPLRGQHLGNRTAESRARAGDQRALVRQSQVHQGLLVYICIPTMYTNVDLGGFDSHSTGSSSSPRIVDESSDHRLENMGDVGRLAVPKGASADHSPHHEDSADQREQDLTA